MSSAVLLLNASYEPLKVISWKKAIQLVLEDKAIILKGYADQFVRSMLLQFERPAVVALKRYVKIKTKVKLSRRNILARDRYQCAYCGRQPLNSAGHPDLSELNVDHVVPRSRAINGRVRVMGREVNVTSWGNVVASCLDCNSKKGARTPEEAGMSLRQNPKAPTPWDALRISITRVIIPEEWIDHLPEDASEWGGYWKAALT